MVVDGVMTSGRDLAESNTFKQRLLVRKKESKQANELWLQAQYNAFAVSLTALQKRADHETNPKQIEDYKRALISLEAKTIDYRKLLAFK